MSLYPFAPERAKISVMAGMRGRPPLDSDRWSVKADSCNGCGSTERKHHAQGLCMPCYMKSIRAGTFERVRIWRRPSRAELPSGDCHVLAPPAVPAPIEGQEPVNGLGVQVEPPRRAEPLVLVKAFKPTAKTRALAKAMRETNETTYAGLAKAAGLEPEDLFAILRNEEAAGWLVDQALRASALRLGEVYLNLANMAATGKSTPWVELALRRFDPAYRPVGEKASAGKQVNVQVNNFAGWSHEELRAFVKAKRQRVLGEAPPSGPAPRA